MEIQYFIMQQEHGRIKSHYITAYYTSAAIDCSAFNWQSKININTFHAVNLNYHEASCGDCMFFLQLHGFFPCNLVSYCSPKPLSWICVSKLPIVCEDAPCDGLAPSPMSLQCLSCRGTWQPSTDCTVMEDRQMDALLLLREIWFMLLSNKISVAIDITGLDNYCTNPD